MCLIDLEKKSAGDGIVLTKAQMAALKEKLDEEACGEIETAHPSYLGSQDIFYVGTLLIIALKIKQTFLKITFEKIVELANTLLARGIEGFKKVIL